MDVGILSSDSIETAELKEVRWLWTKNPFFAWYGLAIPVLLFLTFCCNSLVICVFRHRKMQSLSTQIFCVLLLSDVFFQLTVSLLFFLRTWMPRWYASSEDPLFWDTLDVAQRIYIIAFPLQGVAHCLVVWCTTALLFEHWLTITKPSRAVQLSKKDNIAKLLVSIFLLSVLVHMFFFFSMVQRSTLYHRYAAHKVCLSDLYRTDSMENFEKYGYVLVFYTLPWLLVIALGVVVVIYKWRHKNDQKKYSDEIDDLPLEFRGGKSECLIYCIVVFFIICEGISQFVYFSIMETIDYNHDLSGCHFIPSDRRFINADQNAEFVFFFFLVINSSLRLPTCLAASAEFRHVLVKSFTNVRAYSRAFCHTLSKMCVIRLHKGPEVEEPAPNERSQSQGLTSPAKSAPQAPEESVPYVPVITMARPYVCVNQSFTQEADDIFPYKSTTV